MGRFDGKVALVTGGGRGIGEATCELFGREGAAVVVVDLDLAVADEVAQRIRDAGGRALALACDVGVSAQADATVKRVAEEFGRLDILVACAGVTRDNLIFKMSDDDWNIVLTTHLTGTFNFARAAQSVMVPQRYGKMVFLSSTSALGNRGQTNYSTVKAGLQGMGKTLSIELGKFGINVNVVAPSFVETRMTEATAARMGMTFEQYKEAVLAVTPNGVLGQPYHIANVIGFLAHDDSEYVSGQVIYVAGGPKV